jgi:hypothetical protein
MTADRRHFLRDNAFLVAAVALPLLVVGFFVLASAIPRWTVPPPAYDLLLRVNGPYDTGRPRLAVDFNVRDERVEATAQLLPPPGYAQPASLFLFEHRTGTLRRIPFNLPPLAEGDPPKRVTIDAIAGRRVIGTRAPDGYELQTGRSNTPGLIGDLFGMHRYDQRVVLVNKGRVIPISFPSAFEYPYPVYTIGWLANEGER